MECVSLLLPQGEWSVEMSRSRFGWCVVGQHIARGRGKGQRLAVVGVR